MSKVEMKPLTMEELIEMDGKPVYCVDGENHRRWCVVNGDDECCIDNESGSWNMMFYNMSHFDGSNKLDPMGWIAYRQEREDTEK